MKDLTRLSLLVSSSIPTLVFLLIIELDSVAFGQCQKYLRHLPKTISPHTNELLIAARNPECDDSERQTKILILPVFVPNSQKEPEVEILPMDQYTSYSFESKKNKRNHRNQWRNAMFQGEGNEISGNMLAKLLDNQKANYILQENFDLNQALLNGKLQGFLETNNGGLNTMTSGRNGNDGDGGAQKITSLSELLVKSAVAGRLSGDWDYLGSSNKPKHTSPDPKRQKKKQHQ